MTPGARTLGLVASAAGGVLSIRTEIVEPFVADGWRVAVTLTPTAGRWLRDAGELAAIESVTGLPARVHPRSPGEDRPHPRIDRFAVVPASAGTVAKLALGIGDSQALTVACEAIGTLGVPVVVFPRVNAAHTRHPAWAGHLDALRRGGVDVVFGEDVLPLHEPRASPTAPFPWALVRDRIRSATPRR